LESSALPVVPKNQAHPEVRRLLRRVRRAKNEGGDAMIQTWEIGALLFLSFICSGIAYTLVWRLHWNRYLENLERERQWIIAAMRNHNEKEATRCLKQKKEPMNWKEQAAFEAGVE
jgi:hypothetical protein